MKNMPNNTRRQFTIHLGDDDDSKIIRSWFNEFFELGSGRLGNKVSDHVRQAIVKGFYDEDLHLDHRYMTGKNRERQTDEEG